MQKNAMSYLFAIVALMLLFAPEPSYAVRPLGRDGPPRNYSPEEAQARKRQEDAQVRKFFQQNKVRPEEEARMRQREREPEKKYLEELDARDKAFHERWKARHKR